MTTRDKLLCKHSVHDGDCPFCLRFLVAALQAKVKKVQKLAQEMLEDGDVYVLDYGQELTSILGENDA